MNKNIFKASIILLSTLIFFVLINSAQAVTYQISGNGSDSNNSIQVNQGNTTNVNQSNSANVNNNVNINANTGGNSINGGVGDGSIKTGDAKTNVMINNNLNSNVADVNCKNCPTPTKKPTPTSTTNQPTPTTPPGRGGSDNPPGDSKSTSTDPGKGKSNPSVLGIPATSGENEFANILKLLPALGSFLLGSALLRKNAQ